MQAIFNSLRTFNFAQTLVHLWVFKKSTTANKYTARFVRTDNDLNGRLKQIVQSEMTRIVEFTPYTYLSQTNESSCLSIAATGTYFTLLKTLVDRPEPENAARNIKDLNGAEGYVVKLSLGNQVVYAVKKSSSSWKTSYPKSFINLTFKDGELSAAENTGFTLERNFDFYCKEDLLFIANKRAFESLMEYRDAYTQAVANIQTDASFAALFTNMQPLIDHIGTNSIHLRRMATVEQKALYSDANFLASLARVNALRNWGLNFDPVTNRIIPCALTSKIIMKVLLDHILLSEVTNNMYEVPDATQV